MPKEYIIGTCYLNKLFKQIICLLSKQNIYLKTYHTYIIAYTYQNIKAYKIYPISLTNTRIYENKDGIWNTPKTNNKNVSISKERDDKEMN